MKQPECSLCSGNRWFFYKNKLSKRTEIRRCDLCNYFKTDEVAGRVALDIISTKLHIADVMTEVRASDEWEFNTTPCGQCMKRGWFIEFDEKSKRMVVSHCRPCALILSDDTAADIAIEQIATAFEVANFAEIVRKEDIFIKRQTAKAFGEVKHQWMIDGRMNDREDK